MVPSPTNADFFTVLEPVEAEVFPLEGEIHFKWLQPGICYAVQQVMPDSMNAGPLTDTPEIYFICINHPDEWHRFVFADDPAKLPQSAPTPD